MTVEIERRGGDGHWYFRLGPVERWIVTIFAGTVVAGGYWLVSSAQTLITAQAVTNQKLTSIDQKMAGMENLSQRVSKIEVRQDAQGETLRDLKAKVDR